MVLSLFTMFTEQAFAVETQVIHENNVLACDTLVVPALVHELGTLQPDFPDDELISSSVGVITDEMQDACTPISSGSLTLVLIINESPFDFSDVWYVIDENISVSNFDGTVNGRRAFKIDSVGVHQPLLPETGGTQAGVFESGETWKFILNSYSGPLGTAANFGSVGISSPNPTIITLQTPSTGSIIATPIEKGGTVGGVFIGIDKTAVLLVGAQMTSAWLVPIIVAFIGIGIVLARKF